LLAQYQVEDSVLAFGPLVANNFGARFAQIAWSGAGITTPGGMGGPTIPQLYNRTLPTNASSQWDFSSFVPEVRSLPFSAADLWRDQLRLRC
jgi:hypothetical protein